VHAGNTGDVMKGNWTMGTGIPGAVRRALLVGTVAILAACSGTAAGTASPGAPSAAPATVAPAATPAPTTAASEAASPAASGDLILATTTSTQDSGLLDVLVPAFEATTACKVKTVAVGSGAALKLGEEGNADVLMVHSPAAEKTLVEGGFGVNRQLLMHNMFLVVGPATDPAAINGVTPTKDAFTKIADAKSNFVSRGDGSGTETKELGIWKAAGITPEGDWYVQSGTGMGPTLQIASEKQGYTLTDKATWLATKAKLDLQAMVEKDPALLNIYHMIQVNPDKWPKVNAACAAAFSDFVLSAEGQKLIGEFGVDEFGEQLFVPDAGKDEDNLITP
jgi:tungstate transport system substrate-binding protein